MNIPARATLNDLEAIADEDTEPTSVLGATLRHHRRTPVEHLGAEALRFLLEEGESVPVILRVALDRLEQDHFVAGDFHRGDLLVAALKQSATVWNGHPELRARAFALVADAERDLMSIDVADREIVQRAIRGFRYLWPTWN